MANYPTFHQMPKGSYPMFAHPIYALVGKLTDVIVSKICAINGVIRSTICKMNGVEISEACKINGVEN